LIQPGPIQGGATNAVIPKDVLVQQLPALALDMGLQSLQLLFDGLGLRLSLSRHTYIDRDSHDTPPASEWSREFVPARSTASIAEGVGRPDPIGVAHPGSVAARGEFSTGVSSVPPQ
jgi:hypothetical protein